MSTEASPSRARDDDDAPDDSAVAPVAKKLRQGARHQPIEYIPGSVMRVKLHNFMTYTDVEMEPGPRLNVILGPNGTGKSSFVCALAIGLAGSTKLLGRADKLSEFVKRGEQSGYSEITLATSDPERPLVVRREIKRKDSSSTWRVNNVVVTLDRVKLEMHKLGVQLDNLCQFLPQDRVVEFARLTPESLLMETEKAIGNAELYDMHAELIRMKNDIAGLEREVTNKRAKIEKLRLENDGVERDVTRFNEREKLRETAAEMKTKVPWLVFGNAKARWQNSKAAVLALKKSILAEEDKLTRFKTPAVKAKDELELALVKQKKTNVTRKTLAGKQHAKKELLEELGIDLEAKRGELDRARTKATQRERKIKEREKELRDCEAALARAPPPVQNDGNEEIKDLKATKLDLSQELRALEDDLDALNGRDKDPEHTIAHVSKQLEHMNSVRGQRVRNAANVSKKQNLAAFDTYITENANYFVKPVVGPLLSLMECANSDHRNMLAHVLPNYAFAEYIAQTRADYDKIKETARRLGVDVLIVDQIDWQEPDVSALHKHGVTHRLDQTFEATPLVKTALCKIGAIDKCFVFGATPPEKVEAVFKETNITRACTPDTVMDKKGSRYDGTVASISTAELRKNGNVFTGGVDAAEKAACVKRVAAARQQVEVFAKEIGECTARKKKLEQDIEQAQRRIQSLGQMQKLARDTHNKLTGNVATARAQLESASRTLDVAAIETRVNAELKAMTKQRVVCCLDLVELTTQLADTTHEHATRTLRCKELGIQKAYFDAQWDAANAANDKMRKELPAAENKLRENKELARELRVPAMAATDQRDPGKDPTLQQQFDQWDDDLVVLEEAIAMFENEADAIMCPNEAVLEDYKSRQTQIAEIESTLGAQEGSLGRSTGDIAALKLKWLPKLRELVERINENFKHNFASIGCAGEVRLREDPSGDRFEFWKLEIWVKFRAATDMHILDAHRQSGGERSVSTMLYLISLQELTKAPFRVVDEINQGMDPVNERKIFKRMTDAASKDSTPQTFLLTPKLLNNLKYTEDCTVLCIFNGPWIAEVAKRWRELQASIQPVSPGTPE